MIRAGALLLGLLAAGPALLGPAPAARAEMAVEYFDERGRLAGEERLYPVHRALVLATATGETAALPARREALAAWLATLGMQVSEIGPEAGGAALAGRSAPTLMDRALDWVAAARDAPDAGLVVVIDSALASAQGRLTLDLRDGGAPFDLGRFLAALDATPARHVLVVFTDTVAAGSVDWGRPAPAAGGPGWLTRAASGLARQAIVPWSADLGVVRLMATALSQGPDAAAAAPGHFDPDPFLTARDLAALSPGLSLWTFGGRDAGGDFVLARRELEPARFDGAPSAREAYAVLRFDDQPARLRAFLREGGDDPWHRAAEQQLGRQEQRLRRVAGARCDGELGFDPAEILSLNAGVIGRLDAFDGARGLARAWLGAIRAAAGIGPDRLSQILALCSEAETRPDFAPDRALRLAMVGDGAGPALALASAATGDWPGTREAAVLAGLALLAEGPGRAGPQPVLAALDRAAEAGSGPAQAVRALFALDGAYRSRDTAAALADLAAAATRGVSVAEALAAAVMLGHHPVLEGWRGGAPVDRAQAMAALRRAREAGLAVSPALVDPGALGPERLAACDRALAGVDLAELIEGRGLAALPAFDRLLNRPARALQPALARVAPGAVAAACVPLPEPADLPAELLAMRDAVLVRLALVDLAAGQGAAAGARLAGLAAPDGNARFLAALAAPLNDRPARLGAAAEAGQPLAAAALAMAAAADAQPARRAAGFARLRALSDAGLPLADALLAVRLVQSARAPAGFGAAPARAEADAALMEAILRIAAARAAGFDIRLDNADIAVLATRAPGMLGLELGALTSAHRRLLGPDLPAGAGVLVLAAQGGPLAAGDVILSIGGQPAADLATAQYLMFGQIYAALVQGAPVTVARQASGGGAAGPVTLSLPPAIAAVPVPAGLR